MASKTMFVLAIFAAFATVIMSSPQIIPIPIRPGADGVPKPQISAKEKQEILELVAEKMDEAFPNVGDGIQTRDFSNIFNLSAYLNTNRPTNGTALTFVPLITLLSGVLGG